MFTGIVEELGRVEAVEGPRLAVARDRRARLAAGASVAVNGVCLTVVENTETALAFDVSDGDVDRTTLGRLRPGDPVNLERPVALTARMGGHMVQGHVDGVGTVAEVTAPGGRHDDPIALPGGLEPVRGREGFDHGGRREPHRHRGRRRGVRRRAHPAHARRHHARDRRPATR